MAGGVYDAKIQTDLHPPVNIKPRIFKVADNPNDNPKPEPKPIVKSKHRRQQAEWKTFVATAYTSNFESTGKNPGDKDYGITASGKKVSEGTTIACPPNLSFGTKLFIEGVGVRICEDRGSAITGNRIDIYMENLSDALNFGRKNVKVKIVSREG